jgi:hypothetical protein
MSETKDNTSRYYGTSDPKEEKKRGRPRKHTSPENAKKEYEKERYIRLKDYYNSEENKERNANLVKKYRETYKLLKKAMEENAVTFNETYLEKIKELMK